MRIKEPYNKQIRWLLEGDPAIRYQTLRDLTDADSKAIEAEQAQILKQGWGKRLIDLQQENGTWSNALYSPKWTSTFYTLLLLKRFGAPADEHIIRAACLLLDRGFYAPDGGINYWKTWKQGECCVTGMLLSMLCHFQMHDERLFKMVDYLFSEQMADKGWNCERYRGATHSSFHTTISVLEGLWEFEKAFPEQEHIATVQKKQDEGIEFLLQHHLYKSNTTWKTVNANMTKLVFPPRWHYDIMRGLDYFQEKNLNKDARMNDAVALMTKKQTVDGFWKLELKYPAKVFFDMEKIGQPSRWNTLRALRILHWWDDIE
ncbi:MAG: hypothetical protein DWQ10_09405 [Calditrichaeota bacterium]|nr:MAG: hypothetical protein DWQ10_09405 [Calditrichota bacterium]